MGGTEREKQSEGTLEVLGRDEVQWGGSVSSLKISCHNYKLMTWKANVRGGGTGGPRQKSTWNIRGETKNEEGNRRKRVVV